MLPYFQPRANIISFMSSHFKIHDSFLIGIFIAPPSSKGKALTNTIFSERLRIAEILHSGVGARPPRPDAE